MKIKNFILLIGILILSVFLLQDYIEISLTNLIILFISILSITIYTIIRDIYIKTCSCQYKIKSFIHIEIKNVSDNVYFKSSNDELIELIEDYLRRQKLEEQ